MSTYLVALAIGPVQDFVAAARKTRDLFYGSWLLSELSKTCARLLHERGAKLIFPGILAEDPKADLAYRSPLTVSNKVVATIDAESPAAMRTVADAVHADLNSWLQARYEEMVWKPGDPRSSQKLWKRLDMNLVKYDEQRGREQFLDLVEFYAAWELLPSDEHYKDARKQVDLKLTARKSLRDFAFYTGAANVPKSSLDGFRESVIAPQVAPATRTQTAFHIKPNERLDAVGLLKRCASVHTNPAKDRERLRFDSTHDVAALPFVAKAGRSTHGRSALGLYDEFMKWLDLSKEEKGEKPLPACLTAEDITAEEISELRAIHLPASYSYIYTKEVKKDENATLFKILYGDKGLAKQLAALNPAPPYYALFIGDGDFMGREIDRLEKSGDHLKFSSALSRFAEKVKGVVESHDGQLIYAGGDDVMALLPLHTALACALEVRKAFKDAMAGHKCSFSAGMAVCHAMEPLNDVRELAAEAEKFAKAIDKDKDALAIIASSRSGADNRVRMKWEELGTLTTVAAQYHKKQLTPGFAYELKVLLNKTPNSLNESLLPLAMLAAGKKESKEVAQPLVEKCRIESPNEPDRLTKQREKLAHLANLLLVAKPFARAMTEALGEAAEVKP